MAIKLYEQQILSHRLTKCKRITQTHRKIRGSLTNEGIRKILGSLGYGEGKCTEAKAKRRIMDIKKGFEVGYGDMEGMEATSGTEKRERE